jgi:MFS family permease
VNLLQSKSGRRVLFAALYLSEGAPIGYVWWALPAQLRAAGVPLPDITDLSSLLVLPWALKFLWAPVIDRGRGPRWGYRAWIISAQLAMGVALLPLIWLGTAGSMQDLTVLLLVHAFFAATQDAAVDGLCIANVPEADRGGINGWMQAGMLVGRAVFGGAILYAEGNWWSPQFSLVLMLGCIWSSTILVAWFAKEAPPEQRVEPNRGGVRLGKALRDVLCARSTWLGLLLAATLGAGFEAAGMVTGLMLIDQGLSQESVGLFRAIPVVVAMAIGALLGGAACDRMGRVPAVALFGAVTAGIVGGVAAAVGLTEGTVLLRVLLTGMYLGIGMLTAASYALFMDLTDPRLGATQFSAFMAATNLCEAWAGYTAGRLVDRRGYSFALLLMAAISLASLVLLRWIRRDLAARRGGSIETTANSG